MQSQRLGKLVVGVLSGVLISALTGAVAGATPTADDGVVLGLKVRLGGRYDDVRMCVASGPGVPGGMAADVSFFLELGLAENWSAHIDVPVMRPLLFGAAFEMLQFEPSVSIRRRVRTAGVADVVLGPTLGLSLHHGPDYESERSGAGRGASFFALGPSLGGHVGLDFRRPGESFNFQLGISPQVTPLFSIADPDEHRGWVIGGLLDGSFRWQ
ncbi:MAG: hypothetical protein RBU45_02985 [Myxococcota bacterium]|jgi:hypothetical protein|nr:hypothetical protein [Myxococcota bacterium]